MEYTVNVLRCPTCGANISLDSDSCEYCGNILMISKVETLTATPIEQINKIKTAFQTLPLNEKEEPSVQNTLGFCYLRLGLFKNALSAFEKSMEAFPDNPDNYYSAAICTLNGKKPFLLNREIIEKAESYIDAAIQLQEKAIYYFLFAFIRYDYFYRKHLKVSPNYLDYLQNANRLGIIESDRKSVFSLLKLDIPEVLL